MDRREHHRAHLGLPARLRWNTPFGQRTEIATTLDVSRGGLRVLCESAHSAGVNLWVIFPYDGSLDEGQPEMLARVIRSVPSVDGSANNGGERNAEQGNVEGLKSIVALNFHPKLKARGNGSAPQRERRIATRRALAVPIRVRLQGIPWFEETMSADLSASGLRFVSNREYQLSDILFVSFDSNVSLHWPSETEIPFRVMRLEAAPQTTAVTVALSRLEQPAPKTSRCHEAGVKPEARL